MPFNKNICTIISSMLITVGKGLEEVPKKDILNSESIIRNTVNELFFTFNLNRIPERPRLREYATLHKYFASLSLQDDYNLEKILELTKVNSEYKSIFYNKTDFIAIINEIINEDKINKIDFKDISVLSYIETFVSRLKKLRESYALNTVYVHINSDVLEHLKSVKSNNNTIGEDKQDESDDNVILSPSDHEIWEPNGRRIYKGERTKIKHFPFMASVHIFNNFHCAGSIIKSDLIITASSCLQLAWNNRLFRENPAFLSVRVGSSFYSGGGEVIPVLEVYFHPGYDPKTLRNNLCILRLTRRLKFSRKNKRVKRIDLDRNPWNLPLNTPGITILGWGAKGRSGIIFDPWKNILSFSILDIYPLQDCQDVYTKEYVTHKHFCAGFLSKGGGACNRDVGGPGVVDGKLMGVVSFGSPTCGTPDAPTVFTKLGHYTDWIEEIIEMKVPVSWKHTTQKSDFDFLSAFMATDRPTTTTFRIPPITGKKMEPLSILDVDKSLRMLDENLFKEFVSTMFTSDEIQKYQNIMRNEQEGYVKKRVKNQTEKYIHTKQSASQEMDTEFVTKIFNFDETEVNTETTEIESSDSKESYEPEEYKESLIKEETQKNLFSEATESESDIISFMKKVDLKKIIQEEVKVTPKIKLDTKANNVSMISYHYLSDSEKSGNTDVPDDDGGLSIATDHTFKDMTRSKSKDPFSILPETEIYGLLSEVIEKEVQNKIMNDLQ